MSRMTSLDFLSLGYSTFNFEVLYVTDNIEQPTFLFQIYVASLPMLLTSKIIVSIPKLELSTANPENSQFPQTLRQVKKQNKTDHKVSQFNNWSTAAQIRTTYGLLTFKQKSLSMLVLISFIFYSTNSTLIPILIFPVVRMNAVDYQAKVQTQGTKIKQHKFEL